jgi:hypothetical protein
MFPAGQESARAATAIANEAFDKQRSPFRRSRRTWRNAMNDQKQNPSQQQDRDRQQREQVQREQQQKQNQQPNQQPGQPQQPQNKDR